MPGIQVVLCRTLVPDLLAFSLPPEAVVDLHRFDIQAHLVDQLVGCLSHQDGVLLDISFSLVGKTQSLFLSRTSGAEMLLDEGRMRAGLFTGHGLRSAEQENDSKDDRCQKKKIN